jgi:hypothetical protein
MVFPSDVGCLRNLRVYVSLYTLHKGDTDDDDDMDNNNTVNWDQ